MGRKSHPGGRGAARFLALVSMAAVAGCGDFEDSFPSTDSLPLPPGLQVAATKAVPRVAGPGYVNYLVVTGPTTSSPRALAQQLRQHLGDEGWAMGRLPDTRFHRGELTAESGEVLVVFSKDPCDDRPATSAPPAAAEAAIELRRDARASICVSLS